MLLKSKKVSKLHILYIIITKNNLKINLLDIKGKLILRKSEGNLKNIRKGSINSRDTSLLMMNYVASILKKLKIPQLGIYIRGSTRWKKLSLRRLIRNLNNRIKVIFFKDITNIPHNGCSLEGKRRKRKRRRLKIKRFKKFKIKEYHKWWHSKKAKKHRIVKFKTPLEKSDRVDALTKNKQTNFKGLEVYLANKLYPKKLKLAKKKSNNKNLKSQKAVMIKNLKFATKKKY